MVPINPNNDLFTLINVFHVDPADQQGLVDLLIAATEESMQDIPGFVSANIHKSLDGKRVVNYAQWHSKEHFENMLRNEAAIPHMKQAEELANNYDSIQTEVVDSIS